MSGKIEISRELAAVFADEHAPFQHLMAAKARLRELIAAPVVERQPGVLPCDVKVAPNTTIKKGCKVETLLGCIELRKGQPDKFTRFKNTSSPAPVAVVLPSESAIRALMTKAARDADLIPGANYFTAAELAVCYCLDKVKELNQ